MYSYKNKISYEELQAIVNAADKWRGRKGAVRKLVVSEYIDRDPYDPLFEERTVHYAIYEMEITGRKVLHRHFLLLPDGSIIEIFEKLPSNLSNLNKYVFINFFYSLIFVIYVHLLQMMQRYFT